MRLRRTFMLLLAAGLLVWGAQGVALAQTTQGMGGSGLHNPSDDSWTGATKPGPSMYNYQGGGYMGYPPEPNYTSASNGNGWIHMGSQADLTVTSKIAEIDFAHRRMTLEDGEQFTLPKKPEYTSLPMIGEAVEVTFTEQNGQKVVRQIDPDDTGRSSHSG